MRKVLLVSVLVFGCSLVGYSWGFFGHRVIQQLAIYALPKEMQPFYHRHLAHLVETVVRPDERRSSDPTEAHRHFIDLEAFGPNVLQEMPEAWAAAAAKYSADSLRKYGIVPWEVVRLKTRLTQAFYRQDKDSILFYSADLAHYIQDAHVPLHTSLNHDGQLTGQHGLHSLWESKLPEQHLTTYTLTHDKARYLPNPEQEIWQVVRESHRLVPQVLALEKQASQNFTDATKFTITERNGRTRKNFTDAFSAAYQQALGPMVQDRMRASAERTASFWYTCWVDAGKPNLDKLLPTPRTKAEKKQLKQERKAWKKGTLQEKDLLLTKIRISLMNVVKWAKESVA
ncbi:zinc dependent phospholipase C family protein [Rufibacter psychrotolerans]|uniref:zinc dependent phospholipase C family protein n=1 Tax=Rufibacter psychrotolerans TaxID=2812556 RepID=UPI001967C298|nr:zinc dependent phospholipase C family protein [Rufibacter sp. SYSU D00308]